MNSRRAASLGVILTAVLTALSTAAAVAVSVYPLPTRSIHKPVKFATPPVAPRVVVPCRVAPSVPEPSVITTVTSPVNPVAVLPCASRAVTVTPNVSAAIAVAGGCPVNSNSTASPAVMLTGVLTSGVRLPDVAVSVYPEPTRSIHKSVKPAIPPDTGIVVEPPKLAPEGPVPSVIATVTSPVNPVATLPYTSRAVTVAPNAAPAVTEPGGSIVNSSSVAVPAVTLTGSLSLVASSVSVAVNV